MSNSLIDEKNRSAEHWGIKTKKILKYNWKNLENREYQFHLFMQTNNDSLIFRHLL